MLELIYKGLWYFIIYAFLGWCAEVSFAAVDTGKFVNRGFLNGAVCPIYAYGVCTILVCLTPLKNNLVLLFICSVILTSLIEFITGFILEKIFHDKWWDYSDFPFNIKGYICLKFSLLWGLACIFVVYLIHPPIAKLISFIPHFLGIIFLIIIYSIFIADIIVTIIELKKIPNRLRAINEIEERIRNTSDTIGENLSSKVISAKEKNDERKLKFEEKKKDFEANREKELEEIKAKYIKLMERNSFVYRRVMKAFPNLSKKENHQHITNLIKEYRENQKNLKKNKKDS